MKKSSARSRSRLLQVAAALLFIGLGAAAAQWLGDDGGGRESGRATSGDEEADGDAAPSRGASGLSDAMAAALDLLPPGHGGTEWLTAHGKGPTDVCATCHPQKRCTACHGVNVPHPDYWDRAHGGVARAAGLDACTRCHEDPATECDACHQIDMPHPGNWVASAHRATAALNAAVCANCHTEKTCAACHDLASPEACGKCHVTQLTAVVGENGHAVERCLSCHQPAAAVIGPGARHRSIAGCLGCHDRGGLAPPVQVTSQRNWIRGVGLGKGSWIKRGAHGEADLADCRSCHDVHDAGPRKFPPGVNVEAKGCEGSCHSWVEGDVVSPGFVNASGDSGQTTYRGTLDPTRLLENGTTLHSEEVYEQEGCAGRCHDGPHGTVTECVECHDYAWGTPGNLHTTHVPFVGGEQAAADPENFNLSGGNSCMYCHPPGSAEGVPDGSTVYRGSCWNCHLSGHNPITPYWELPQG